MHNWLIWGRSARCDPGGGGRGPRGAPVGGAHGLGPMCPLLTPLQDPGVTSRSPLRRDRAGGPCLPTFHVTAGRVGPVRPVGPGGPLPARPRGDCRHLRRRSAAATLEPHVDGRSRRAAERAAAAAAVCDGAALLHSRIALLEDAARAFRAEKL